MTDETLATDQTEESGGEVEPTLSNEDGSQENTEETKKEVRKYRVKGDGFDEEVDEATLIKGYQLERTANKRIEDAGKIYKNVKPYIPIIQALQKGDLSVLKKLGLPPEAIRKFSEQELMEYIDSQDESPEARARHAERERDRLKAERDEITEREAKRGREAAAHKAAQDLDNDMRSALESAKIPVKGNYLLVRRIAEDMYGQIEAGNKPSAKDSLAKVLKGLTKDYGEHATREFARDPDAFISSLPADIVDGIRKRSLKEVQSQLPIGNMVDNKTNKKPRSKADEDFREHMRREFAKRG